VQTIRSRTDCIEGGTNEFMFYKRLDENHEVHNCIDSLKENNSTYKSDSEILNYANKFYSDLYTSTQPCPQDIVKYLSDVNVFNILSDEDKKECEGLVNIDECEKVIKFMKLNKSPGLDGLPVEFYQIFWDEIKYILIDMYNESFIRCKLPESLSCAVMSLIFKKGDQQLISNYRPISLTNTDYRIIAFVLAQRMQGVIGSSVSPDQSAYIHDRFIGTNVRIVEDIIDHYNTSNKEGILMFLDLKKAFDTLEWDFMFQVLKLYNFGDDFIKWIKTLYYKPKAIIKNNGHFSEDFEIFRGIRQGCPVSSLIFILCVEILASKIKEDKIIKGMTLSSDEDVNKVKIIQYADDGTLFLNNIIEMKKAIKTIETFGKLAGTKLNLDKCEGLWIGLAKQNQQNCNLLNIKWPIEPIKYLGIYIGHDKQKCLKLNWHNKIEKLKETLNKWKHLNLTLFGKVNLIKSLAISKLTHSATCLEIPDNIDKEINNVTYEFIWGNVDKISRKSSICKLKQDRN